MQTASTSTRGAIVVSAPPHVASDFQKVAMELMGSIPTVEETQRFVTSYLRDYSGCLQRQSEAICSASPSPRSAAQSWIEQNNAQDVAGYRAKQDLPEPAS
jgi:hypothetical protein